MSAVNHLFALLVCLGAGAAFGYTSDYKLDSYTNMDGMLKGAGWGFLVFIGFSILIGLGVQGS